MLSLSICIIGLQGLECLTELDLSFNCLMEHLVLLPLQKMSTLLWLSLEGNPLSYHPKHRILTIKHLHPSLSDSKVSLCNIEKKIVKCGTVVLIYLHDRSE